MPIEATNPALQAASQVLQQRQQTRFETDGNPGRQNANQTAAAEGRAQQGSAVDRGTDGVRLRVSGDNDGAAGAQNRRDPGQLQRGGIVNILV